MVAYQLGSRIVGFLPIQDAMPFDYHMKILIVDDMLSMRKIVRLSLKQLGFNNLDEAENGEHALSKLRTYQYGLVVSDWNMPVMPGIALLRTIRADERLKKLPVLMITAEAQKDNLVEAMQAGVSQYIAKPFTTDILHNKLRQLFP
jgi:two-component system, chemotaxis family, chemotaxis protein CheY